MGALTTPAGLPSLTIGGHTFTDLANLIVLVGTVNGAANGSATLRKVGGSAGYQVPAGKSFVMVAIRGIATTAGQIFICYTDNDLGMSSATAPVNYVAPGNFLQAGNLGTASTTSIFERDCGRFSVPTGKYPGVANGAITAVGTFFVYGYEV